MTARLEVSKTWIYIAHNISKNL